MRRPNHNAITDAVENGQRISEAEREQAERSAVARLLDEMEQADRARLEQRRAERKPGQRSSSR